MVRSHHDAEYPYPGVNNLLSPDGCRMSITLDATVSTALALGADGIFFIFLFATVLTSLGLFWLLKLAHGSDMLAMWSVLLSQSPQLVNSAVIFIIIGWLGLAVYLPWWIWGRREESALILLPMILAIAIVCVLSLVRVIFLLFPAGGDDVTRLPGVENIFLIERIIGWLFFWGILAILMGSCWLCVLSIRQRIKEFIHLKPLSLVISGVLLLTLAGGLAGQFAGNLAQRDIAMTGMLWGILAWCGITTIWLTAGNLFNVMTLREQGERYDVDSRLLDSISNLAGHSSNSRLLSICITLANLAT